MSLRLGMDAKLYRNTGTHAVPIWTVMGNVKDLTLNLEAGEADVTVRANAGWKATIATLRDASIEFVMVWDTGDAGFAALQTAFFSNGTLEVAVMDGDIATTGSQGLRALVSILKFSRKEPLEEAITAECTIKPTYSQNAPEWMVVA